MSRRWISFFEPTLCIMCYLGANTFMNCWLNPHTWSSGGMQRDNLGLLEPVIRVYILPALEPTVIASFKLAKEVPTTLIALLYYRAAEYYTGRTVCITIHVMKLRIDEACQLLSSSVCLQSMTRPGLRPVMWSTLPLHTSPSNFRYSMPKDYSGSTSSIPDGIM